MARILVVTGMVGMLLTAATAYADHGEVAAERMLACTLTPLGDVAACE